MAKSKVGRVFKYGVSAWKFLWHSTEQKQVVDSNFSGQLSFDDWRRALLQTKDSLGEKHLPILAAGIAYYSTLAFFPLLAAAVAIGALVITPNQLDALLGAAESYLPGDVASLVGGQIEDFVSNRSGNFLAAGIATLVALFGASGASKNLIVASNVAFDVKETRAWLRRQIIGIIWTFGGIIFGFVVMVLLVLNQSILGGLLIDPNIVDLLLMGRWLIMLVLAILGLSVFYRYGPNRSPAKWTLVFRGATVATLVWLLATLLFFAYVQNFGNYAKSYSLFAGIIVLMIWLNFSALIVLLGAELNRSLEKVAISKY